MCSKIDEKQGQGKLEQSLTRLKDVERNLCQKEINTTVQVTSRWVNKLVMWITIWFSV